MADLDKLAEKVAYPTPLLQGIDINDNYRVEQRIGHINYLNRVGISHTEHLRRQQEDPLNVEFAQMPVLKISLVLPKNTLTPILDKRVMQMVSHPDFFNEAISFAKEVTARAEASNDDDEALLRLEQHALVRAIGFLETVKFMGDIAYHVKENS